MLGGGLLALAVRDPSAVADDPKAPLIAALTQLGRQAGIGVDELAIGFARSFPEVSVILVGVSSSTHLRRNIDVMTTPPLPDDVRDAVLALADEVPAWPILTSSSSGRGQPARWPRRRWSTAVSTC